MATQTFAPGGYRFIPAVFQYSGGVAAEPGFAIERVTFRTPVPLVAGFERIAQFIKARGRPLTAFCACELRSPEPFTDVGFRQFNEVYVKTLAAWGIYDAGTRVNPVARSNVCPELGKPAEPSFHAFSFTDVAAAGPSTFVVAGSGEAREGGASYRERTVRYGETSAEALREKAIFVLGEMERRLGPARCNLERHHGHPGLYRARFASIPGGRDRQTRGGARGADLAFLPAAGARPRIRNGLPRRCRRALAVGRRHNPRADATAGKPLSTGSACVARAQLSGEHWPQTCLQAILCRASSGPNHV